MPPIDLAGRIEAATAIATAPVEGEAPSGGDEAPVVPAAAGFADEVEEASAETPEAQEQSKILAAKRAVIEEKLQAQRERRQANALGPRAKEAMKRAQAAEAAANAERQKWEALKNGSFREGIAAMGRDPGKVFEEMQREAIEASTPEFELKRMRADFEKQMGEKLAPLQETIEALKREREEMAAAGYENTLVSAFKATVADPEYLELRAEYDDQGLFEYVQHFDKNPKAFFAAAKHYNVRLTDPARGFTMPEILSVLKAAQDAHDRGKQERRTKLLPASPPGQTQPGKPHTVNGTAARSNAGTPIGNDLATERAAPGRKLSRKERIQAEIDRLEKR